MGTDINLHIEVQIKGQWHHYACPNIDRTYTVFEQIGNPRGTLIGTPIVLMSDLPDDKTPVTKYSLEESGSSYPSCVLSWDKVRELSKWMLYEGYYLEDWLGCYLFDCCFNEELCGIEDLRMLVWYD